MGTLLQQLHQDAAEENEIYCKHCSPGKQNAFRKGSKKVKQK